MTVAELLKRGRAAARAMQRLEIEKRDRALEAIAEAIVAAEPEILAANAADLEAATDISDALRDRLRLTPERVAGMAKAVRDVRALNDPLGQTRELGTQSSGIRVTRRRVPLGVIAIVYEARPNVTAECAALTIKSGNAVILRGGKEAKESNRAVARAVHAGLEKASVPVDAVLGMFDSTRDDVRALLGAVGQVDLVIPRGGEGLMRMVDESAKVPVIRHGQGICAVYVDRDADPEMAQKIAFNAKVHRPGVCNAMETLLVHDKRLDLLGPLGRAFMDAGVEMRADPAALGALQAADIPAKAATDQDWDTEFLDLVVAIKTVEGLDQALDHIAEHGTHHTAAIVTRDAWSAEQFLAQVDASCVLWNASTRFNDGGQLGLGAEMGISTSKMHAYGPMGVTELTAEKLVVYGTGQTRS